LANSSILIDRLLREAMLYLAAQPGAVFVGQSVRYPGAMFKSLEGVPMEQRIEFPVAEELQMGMATGMAIQGLLPISIYPRMDFLLRAADSLTNHLDKLEAMSDGQFAPKVIIRTRVGSKKPLDAGPQHSQNHVRAFKLMLTNIAVVEITQPDSIMPVYQWAVRQARSSLIVENFQ
jgi:pyruvate/2-oxoglutarate/acetoin dehydrogenase E1 component